MAVLTKTLSAPLRVYWSVAPEELGGISGELAAKVAAELASLKVFFVTFRLASGPRADLSRLVESLKKGGTRVTVSLRNAGCFSGHDALAGVDAVDLSPENMPELEGLLSLFGDGRTGKPLSVSVVPARDNVELVAEVIRRSLTAGITVFGLPNPDVVSEGSHAGRFVLDDADRQRLRESIEPMLKAEGERVKLSVHDLFLHTSLTLPGLGAVTQYAGCQAGDAMAFIGETGLVYPCSTWPEPLGRLNACTFKEIWSSESRIVMREMVGELPADCADCPEGKICKGGCAGLAYAVGNPGGKDPGCCR